MCTVLYLIEWSDFSTHRALVNTNTDTYTCQMHLVCWTMTSFQEKEERITWQANLRNQLFMLLEARVWLSNASGYWFLQIETDMQNAHACKEFWVDMALMKDFSQAVLCVIWETAEQKTDFNLPEKREVSSCQPSKKGGEKEREREKGVTRRVCFCVGESSRQEEGCRQGARERELQQSLRSWLWWRHPVEEHMWSRQQQKGSWIEQRRSRDIL